MNVQKQEGEAEGLKENKELEVLVSSEINQRLSWRQTHTMFLLLASLQLTIQQSKLHDYHKAKMCLVFCLNIS